MNQCRPRNKHVAGFTLVELLCVIAIIGLLIAMLLPAVSQVREAARNTVCKNNLRQMALACLTYETANQSFPAGTLGYASPKTIQRFDYPRWLDDPEYDCYLDHNQNTSWLVHVLPFLEQSVLSDRLPAICTDENRSYREYRDGFASAPRSLMDLPEVQLIAGKSVNVFMCPSAIGGGAAQESLIAGGQPVYEEDLGIDGILNFEFESPRAFAGTNYLASSGAYSGGSAVPSEMRRYDGAFASRTPRDTSDFRDGLSNSILIGEAVGWREDGEHVSAVPWMFANMGRARSDLDWMRSTSTRSPGLELLGDRWYAWPAGFGSFHPTSVNFAHADGSVQTVSREVSWEPLYRLCGIADGTLLAD